jgi:hypothetical protein
MDEFEAAIASLTQPLNGQYPRPWMTKLQDPQTADVFIVGKNQARGFPVDAVGAHERFMDALFNRNGQSIRGLYDALAEGKPSPTRRNIDGLTTRLERHGVTRVLETNVVCYSTPMSRDLAAALHAGGLERGQEIFTTLLHFIRPQILIAHGADTARRLARLLKHPLPPPPETPDSLVSVNTGSGTVYVIQSLAPPAYNKWSTWAPAYLDSLARAVAAALAQ